MQMFHDFTSAISTHLILSDFTGKKERDQKEALPREFPWYLAPVTFLRLIEITYELVLGIVHV